LILISAAMAGILTFEEQLSALKPQALDAFSVSTALEGASYALADRKIRYALISSRRPYASSSST